MQIITKLAVSTAASVLAILLAGGSAMAQQAAPARADPSAVAVSGRLIAAAAAFETYTGRAATIKADFKSAESVATALRSGSAYETKQMQAGEIAFAAIIALQDADFVQAARSLGRDPAAADRLLRDPSQIAALPGAEAAAARIGAALRERGAKVLAVGQAVKQSAYDIQHQAWSLASVAEPQAVLANSKALSQVQFAPAADDTARLIKLAGATSGGGDRQAVAMPVIQRGLALAALAVMGQAGDGSDERIAPLLVDNRSSDCMRMAKLNLYQCLAVAGPQYEDVFCLGQHALMDTGQCVIASATPRVARPAPAAKAGWTQASASPTGGAMLIPVASVAPQP
jgi:hypothetical protein